MFIRTRRFQWSGLQWEFKPFSMFAGDEWHNSSIIFQLPLLGEFVLFYRKKLDRSGWFHLGTENNEYIFISPNAFLQAKIPMENARNLPTCFYCEDDDMAPLLPINNDTVHTLARVIEKLPED